MHPRLPKGMDPPPSLPRVSRNQYPLVAETTLWRHADLPFRVRTPTSRTQIVVFNTIIVTNFPLLGRIHFATFDCCTHTYAQILKIRVTDKDATALKLTSQIIRLYYDYYSTTHRYGGGRQHSRHRHRCVAVDTKRARGGSSHSSGRQNHTYGEGGWVLCECTQTLYT